MNRALSVFSLLLTLVLGVIPAAFLLFLGMIILLAGINGLVNGEYWQGALAISWWLVSFLGLLGLWFAAMGIQTLYTLVFLLMGIVTLSSFTLPIVVNDFNFKTSFFLWSPIVVAVIHVLRITVKIINENDS